MVETLLSTDELLRELRSLGLPSPDWSERLAADRDSLDDSRAFAARLVEAGLLTAYQVEQVLTGNGRLLFVGPYVLHERLGVGGMGHVYKAEHRLMKRVVALKFAGRASGRRGESDAMSFRREVEAAGRLSHPSIVTAYDAGESRGRLYLAMEYVEGVDLERLVGETGPLSVDLACEIVRQTAEALHHAHERGLVHRDIKPSNLMLASPGVTVKLLDLGLASPTDNPLSAEDAEERDEELCGTPDYMAPESGRGRSIDVRGDLYSLGCTFYFLLTGQVPYPGGSWTDKLLRHHLDTPVPMRELRPDVPAEIGVVVERLMARDREDRYPTAAAVAAALSTAGSGEPETVAVEVRTAPVPQAQAPRRFWMRAFAAIVFGVIAAGGARWIGKPPIESLAPSEKIDVAAFGIEGRSEGFVSLEKALAAAREGDVVTVHGRGPFVTPPLSWRGKSLTVRGTAGARPRLEMKSSDDPWASLFRTDRKLSLEGLELVVAKSAPLICCERADLHLTDCHLSGGADGTAIVARNPQALIVRNCRIDAGAVGLSVEVGQFASCRIQVIDSRLIVRGEAGTALSLWAAEVRHPTAVGLELRGNAIRADRTMTLRALPAGLTVSARANRFTFRSGLLNYTGYADRDAWRRDTVWQGGDNSYDGPASWLWVEGKPASIGELTRPR